MYADKDFYVDEYFGTVIPEADIDSFLSKASEQVDQVTYYSIQKRGGFDQLTPFQQRQVKLAVCVQADYAKGLEEMPDWVQSYSVGSVSVSKKEGASTLYSAQSLAYLRATNLMYRGLGS